MTETFDLAAVEARLAKTWEATEKPAIRYRKGKYQLVCGRKIVWRGRTLSDAVHARAALAKVQK